MNDNTTSCCSCATIQPAVPASEAPPVSGAPGRGRYLLTGLPLLGAWWLIYTNLPALSQWLTGIVIQLGSARIQWMAGPHFREALSFFIYDTPKVLMLLTLVVFAVGIVRSFFTAERTRRLLAGRRESAGNVLAALLGIVTPFCSCSAVPLFIGFVSAGVPLGVTFSFLISAPMVNEVALILLYGMFGWKVAAIYLGTGLAVAMVAGWTIGRLKMEKHLEDWVREIQTDPNAGVMENRQTWQDRIGFAANSVREIVGKVWLFVVLGIAVGAGIHGYVPQGYLAALMGKGAWWSVPIAVLIGVPLYSNAAGVIPVVSALLGKGAALGTVLAFMMSVIAISLPETIILRKVLKPRLLAVFIGVVAFGIVFVGYLFNFII
jgi:hypothetical protein